MPAACRCKPMDSDVPADVDRPASAATTLSSCPLAAAVARAEPPLWVWRDPYGHAHLGTGEAVRIVAEGATRFGTLEDGLEALTDELPAGPDGPLAFVGTRFFPESPRDRTAWDDYQTAVATVPSVQLSWRPDGTTTLTVVDRDGAADLDGRLAVERERFEDPQPPATTRPAVTERSYTPSPRRWRELVDEVTDRLTQPPLEKAVLAAEARLSLDGEPDRGALVASLIDRHPGCWTFLHAPTDESMFVGATPERLATVDGSRLRTVALAGSIGRGADPAEDDRLRHRLLEREATRHEHASVVGDIVSRLGGITDAISVRARRVRQLADVQHIETPIEAELSEGTGLLDVAGRLHPTPAVGGRPRASALALIRELEPIERGWYAAPIGVIDPAGNGTLAVGLRSARIDGSTVTLYAGNGIVATSDPDEEWEELLLKVQAMAEVFDG